MAEEDVVVYVVTHRGCKMSYLDIARQVRGKEIIEKNLHVLIDQTMNQINEAWDPGTLEWMKVSRPEEWRKMLALEVEINKTALGGDLDGLMGILNSYRGIILAIVKEFEALKEKKEQGMFNFVERPKSPGTGERWIGRKRR
jgi:hypothetical protein